MVHLTAAQPLFSLSRQNLPEVAVFGFAVAKLMQRPVVGHGSTSLLVTRSLLKPWQFLASAPSGAERFWAMGLASHSGQAMHLQSLEQLTKETGAAEQHLICPRGFPLDQKVTFTMQARGDVASRFYHPCSGKHLVMLASCRSQGWPLEYWEEEHPLQQKLYSFVAKEAGERLSWVKDSCGLPGAAMPISTHAAMWERLALGQNESFVRMKDLWTQNPRLVGGENRLDSDLTELGKGRLLAKEGADGLLMVQSLPMKSGEPVGSCLIKLASGYHGPYLALALLAALKAFRNLPPVFDDVISYLHSRMEEWIPKDQTYTPLLPLQEL